MIINKMQTPFLTILLGLITAYGIIHGMNMNETITVPEIMEVQLFQKWVIKHNRSYSTPKELIYRLGVFTQNYRKIMELSKHVTHSVGLTKFADLTEVEFKAKYTGLKFVNSERKIKKLEQSLKANPPAIDWRELGAVNPVQDQGMCGSCWAFSATAAVEGAYKNSGKTLTKFSEQQLVDCSTKQGNMGCNGGWMDWAFTYIETNGFMTETDYPYAGVDQRCKFDQTKVVTKIVDFTDVIPNNGQHLEDASANHVVSVAVDATALQFYNSGIISSNCGTSLDHGVTLVGYGVEADKDFWIVRNSWSATWGEAGYFRVEKSLAAGPGLCGIQMKPSYPDM